MKLLGLIGRTLTHSFSKNYFDEKFEREKITHYQFELFPLDTIDELPLLVKNHPNLIGFAVTIPYKQEVIRFLDEVTEVVAESNACNCVKIMDDRLIGYNTDVIGIEQSLIPVLKPHHDSALILGTGGAAKAVQFVLDQVGIPYINVSRNPSENEVSYAELTAKTILENKLIINCTPVGMYPHMEVAPAIDFEAITNEHLLFDLIYNPAKTLFLKRGAEKGATILNGLQMLEIQAEANWKIWNG